MRTYGRTKNADGSWGGWVEVATDADGTNDYVYITALIQCLRLNLSESPFYRKFGIPAKEAVQNQMQPDFYVAYIQEYFSQFFPLLILTKAAQPVNDPTPVYNIYIVRNNGSIYQDKVAF